MYNFQAITGLLRLVEDLKCCNLCCCTMQEACDIDTQYIANFGEEIIRGQPLFVLSILLQNLEPMLRKTAGKGDWQV